MRRRHESEAGFTIVELLVVIGIIAILLGLLVSGLSGVQKRSQKTEEINMLRQVGFAWGLYASNHNDSALPGFMTNEVQQRWKLTYKFPDGTEIPPAPTYSPADDNFAGPWTWRLLPYLDFNHSVVHAHLDEDDETVMALQAEAQEAAYEPAFGYNGYYVGGYWDTMIGTTPTFKFYDHCGTDGRRLTIPTSIGNITRSSDMVTFCSSTFLSAAPGQITAKLPSNQPGGHLIVPPILGTVKQWETQHTGNYSDPMAIEVYVDTYAPLARYTNAAAVIYADNHTDSQSAAALLDRRKWINSADDARQYTHDVCPPTPP